jgi:hypothetical protein
MLGDHADAVPLPQARQKVLFCPVELETVVLDPQHLGHVASNHPPDLNADRLLLKLTGTHSGLLACLGIFLREGSDRGIRRASLQTSFLKSKLGLSRELA